MTGANTLADTRALPAILRDGLTLTVRNVVQENPFIRTVHLTAADSTELPGFTPGSHLVVGYDAGGRVRTNAYSLIGSGWVPAEYSISVLLCRDGNGGSRYVHGLQPGDTVRASRPRSALPPVTTARHHLLIAAGIGITPILSHARAAAHWGRRATVVYVYRPGAEAHLGALRELAAAGKIALIECAGRARFAQLSGPLLSTQPIGTHLYTCGPDGFMTDLLEQAQQLGWPADRLHSEAFGAADTAPGRPFTARVGERAIPVAETQSLLEALEGAGLEVPNLCRQGVCGECALTVVRGDVEHRDSFLSPTDRERGDRLMCCVSRATTDELELSL